MTILATLMTYEDYTTLNSSLTEMVEKINEPGDRKVAVINIRLSRTWW